jgi:N-glycosylase/DNA lyase
VSFQFAIPADPLNLDVRLCVSCGQVFRWRETPDGALVGVDGDCWWVVRQDGREVHVSGSGSVGEFRRLFRDEEDWEGMRAELLARGPELAPFVTQLPGLRLLAPADAVEETFSFLCTSNNHLVRITSMVASLAAYGPVIAECDGQALYRFPSVETIAAIPEDELRAKGFGYRAATIPVAARQIVERGGAAWLDGLKSATREVARAEFLGLSGVGPKLADCVCLFALGHRDAVPVDTHVRQALVRLYHPHLVGQALAESSYRAFARDFRSRFGGLAGWAHQFLFYENLLNWRRR